MSTPSHTSDAGEYTSQEPIHPLPRVAVLLASYNGLAYIAEQVESILTQQGCEVRLFISDDLSTDGTWQWLNEKARAEPRIQLLPRMERFGNAARNFYRLLSDTDTSGCDYVALSDQDDVWHKDKLSVSIQKLHEHKAAAVSSNVIAMWPDGRRKLIRKSQRQRKFDFLFGSAGPGCTYLLTRTCTTGLRTFLIQNRSDVDHVQFHDWMIYAWARSHGFRWHIESMPTMLYRQHHNNEYGANSGWVAFRRRLDQVRSGWYREQILNISELIRSGETFTPECAAIVRLIENRTFTARVALLGKVRHLRRETRDRALLALALVLGGV
jgi:rhamnosyltransferase